MRRPVEVAKDLAQIGTIVNLTGALEGIASLRISQIKNQVLQSEEFFKELWKIYTQIRVDATFHFGRRMSKEKVINKDLFIVITAEGGFSGDIDQKLIDWMLDGYDKEHHDIIVIGHHGAVQLAHKGVSIAKYYKLPSKDKNINVTPVVNDIQKYKTTTVYYQSYVSIMVQDVKRMSLMTAVQEFGRDVKRSDEIITESNYIFEPSTYAVIDHLERSMLSIMVGQVILESKLAQYASRFRAMSAANEKAKDSFSDLKLLYNRTRRASNDERLKEIINGMRKVHV
ncbi:hypothetical protein DYH10_03150 [Candidatus Saccharibacteria bacterium CPR2]|nr:hypothetical protein [Candidatus Saccharibacteria bacterium CPR2]